VRFEIGRFEDEGDTVRRRFIGQKEGGRAALRFGSPCIEEGATSSGARRGNADRAGGSGSGGGRRWLPKVGWAGVAEWAECYLGRCEEKKKRDGPQGRLGQNDFGLRWEKEKGFQILFQGIIFKSKFLK
jgi:hypothetical protein